LTEQKVNLFIYGSLRDRKIFQSVSGFGFTYKPSAAKKNQLLAEPALLAGYHKVSPDNVYYYAVRAPASKIDGLLIYDVLPQVMDEIDKYEGKRYKREAVRVNTASGTVRAQAYLVSRESMKKRFGDRWHVNLIHELWLRKRIEKFLKKKTRPGEKSKDAELERIADRELLATTERDLVISHYRTDAISDYFIEHELDRPRPSIKHLFSETQAKPYVRNYLSLVIKQVLLNQLDEKIQDRYRFELEHMRTSERYFKRSLSLLSALRIINENAQTVSLIVKDALKTMPFGKYDLIDYVKYAVRAAGSIFDDRVSKSQLEFIRMHFSPGLTPLGAELEFSNVGSAAVEPQRSIRNKKDIVYDNFRYFYDFALHILSWKLGGYIDDHSGATTLDRRMGFLELAPGRLNIEGELSRPATADPWTLNQLIYEIVNFYDVHPHSLHLSFQLRRYQIGNQQLMPPGFAKCLLALGGGPQINKSSGKIQISRIANNEIMQYKDGEELVLARTSKRRWFMGEDTIAEKLPSQVTSWIQQYKFIRLEKNANYEPLIMCLKGLQFSINPADYLTIEQLKSGMLQSQYEELKEWAISPSQISQQTITKFLEAVRDGLMNEGHHLPVHQLHYIEWAINSIDVQLRIFNREVKKHNEGN